MKRDISVRFPGNPLALYCGVERAKLRVSSLALECSLLLLKPVNLLESSFESVSILALTPAFLFMLASQLRLDFASSALCFLRGLETCLRLPEDVIHGLHLLGKRSLLALQIGARCLVFTERDSFLLCGAGCDTCAPSQSLVSAKGT